MKHHALLLILLAFTAFLPVKTTEACVGRILYVGALNSPEEKMLAEMLVLLINERTGTTVKTRFFDNNDQLYKAFQADAEEERVDIIVEDTKDAATVVNLPADTKFEDTYSQAKNKYEEKLNIIWLSPFGFSNLKGETEKSVIAPLVRRDVLTNFPLLPRVLNKLAGAINDEAFSSLLKSVKAGDKPNNIAKDFLRTKKFI